MSLHHRFAVLALLAFIPLGAACSGSTAEPLGERAAVAPSPPDPVDAAPGADASASADGSVADKDAGKPACNALVNVASDVAVLAQPSAPPPAKAGAIADGTYVLTSATLYTGPGGAAGPTGETLKMTLAIDGSDGQSVFDGVTRSTKLEIVGDKLRSTSTCPGTGTDEIAYSATATTLALYLLDSKGTRVYSLERM
jgi:hypothetical protein